MKKQIFLIILLMVLILIFVIFAKVFNTFYIFAKFKELRPFHNSLPVYYKGIVVGKTFGIKHSLDFEHTIIKIRLFSKKITLPSNTTIILKKEIRKNKEKDFLELVYPEVPNEFLLTNYSEIDGFVAINMNDFLINQHPDDLNEIKENLLISTQNLNLVFDSLLRILEIIEDTLRENRKNIKNTTANIEKTTTDIFNITSDLKKTVPNIENTIEYSAQTMSNINDVVCGIRRILSNKFGIIKLLFGQVVK